MRISDSGVRSAPKSNRGIRNPVATRKAILDAARLLLSRDGPEALSVARVAQLARVNRGTAYQHFHERDELIRAVIRETSETLSGTLFPSNTVPSELIDDENLLQLADPFDDQHVINVADRMSKFVMENSELCRVWLFDLLGSDNPSADPFGKRFVKAVTNFCRSEDAQPGIDGEVYAVIALASYLIWPIWIKAKKFSAAQRQAMARRFVVEFLRLAAHGLMRHETFPNVLNWIDEQSTRAAANGSPNARSSQKAPAKQLPSRKRPAVRGSTNRRKTLAN